MSKEKDDNAGKTEARAARIIPFVPKKPNDFFLKKLQFEKNNLEALQNELKDLEKLINENLDDNLFDK